MCTFHTYYTYSYTNKQSLGGDLARIGSSEDHAALTSVMNTCARTWIGLHNPTNRELWKWSNDEPLGYALWGKYEPQKRKEEQGGVLVPQGGAFEWRSALVKKGGADCYACIFDPWQVRNSTHKVCMHGWVLGAYLCTCVCVCVRVCL